MPSVGTDMKLFFCGLRARDRRRRVQKSLKEEQRHPSSHPSTLSSRPVATGKTGGRNLDLGTRFVAGDRCVGLWEGAGISLAKFIQTEREPDPTETARCAGAPRRLPGRSKAGGRGLKERP